MNLKVLYIFVTDSDSLIMENSTISKFRQPLLVKRVLAGGVIGLAVISLFVVPSLASPDAEWSKYWFIRPFIITPLAGAAGGVVFHLIGPEKRNGTGLKILSYVAAALISLVGLWLGIVLGLDGTLWN